MKVTSADILSSVWALSKLRSLGLTTVLEAKRINRALEPVQKELDEFDVARKEAARKYDVADKKESEAPPEKWAAFQKEFVELLEEEHDFPNLPIEIPSRATGLTPEEVAVLEKLNFITVKE